MEYILLIMGLTFAGLIIAGLQRAFSSETLANGFMDIEKLKSIFKKK